MHIPKEARKGLLILGYSHKKVFTGRIYFGGSHNCTKMERVVKS